MKYIRNFSEHSAYEAEISKIPTPSVSYCRKENECHFVPSNVIMFKVVDLNGNTNQTVTVEYKQDGSDTIPITEGNKWYVITIPSGKILNRFLGNGFITDTIISAKLANRAYYPILSDILGNVTFIGCDTTDLTTFSSMFYYCDKLTSLDVSSLDTSKATDMYDMFGYCESLQTLDVSNFDTSKVTDMSYMFNFCSSLQTLDLSNFDTSEVTDMSFMFNFCQSLQTLDVSNFDTSKVTNMNAMFNFCSSLQTLDVSNFDTSKVTNMYYMFDYCKSLQTLDLSSWNMTKVIHMDDMFSGCTSLKTIFMRGCNQITIDKIKAQLEKGKLNNVTILTE